MDPVASKFPILNYKFPENNNYYKYQKKLLQSNDSPEHLAEKEIPGKDH